MRSKEQMRRLGNPSCHTLTPRLRASSPRPSPWPYSHCHLTPRPKGDTKSQRPCAPGGSSWAWEPLESLHTHTRPLPRRYCDHTAVHLMVPSVHQFSRVRERIAPQSASVMHFNALYCMMQRIYIVVHPRQRCWWPEAPVWALMSSLW